MTTTADRARIDRACRNARNAPHRRPTYKAAKAALWRKLEAAGWQMSNPALKVPHATDALGKRRCDIDGKRVWFKPQSIHIGWTTRLGDARALTYDDIRDLPTAQLVRMIAAYA